MERCKRAGESKGVLCYTIEGFDCFIVASDFFFSKEPATRLRPFGSDLSARRKSHLINGLNVPRYKASRDRILEKCKKQRVIMKDPAN